MNNSFLEKVELKNTPSDYFIDRENISKLAGILSSQQKNNVIYSGLSGTGKSTDIELIAHALTSDENANEAGLSGVRSSLDGKTIYSLDLNQIFAANDPADIDRNLASIINTLNKTENAIIVIEDANQLVENTAKSGFLNAFMDVLRDTNNQAIIMVSEDEVGKKQKEIIEAHSDKTKLFSVLNKNEPSKKDLASIMEKTRESVQSKYKNLILMPEADEEILKLTEKYKSQPFYAKSEPDISLSLRDIVIGYIIANQQKIIVEQVDALGDDLEELEAQLLETTDSDAIQGLKAIKEEIETEIKNLIASTPEDSAELKTMKAERDKYAAKVQENQSIFANKVKKNAEAYLSSKIKKLEDSKKKISDDDQLTQINAEIVELEMKDPATVTFDEIFEERLADETLINMNQALAPMLGKLAKANELIADKVSKERAPIVIDAEAVQYVFETFSGIPVRNADAKRMEKLKNAVSILQERVQGQDHAIQTVARSVQRAEMLKHIKRKKPIGSFLLIGPTGTGKTELAKTLAEFNSSEDDLVRFDMSEFKDSSAQARLIGAAPGLVGYEKGGELTNQVSEKPNSVVLFDEIEKADLQIFNLCLQILDDGRLTDTKGKTVSFKDTVVIMTSNIGSKHFFDLPYEEAMVKAEEDLRKKLPPELLARMNDIIYFNKLTPDVMINIANKVYKKSAADLEETNVKINLADGAIERLVGKVFDTREGARPTVRAVSEGLQDAVVEVLFHSKSDGDIEINVDFDEKTNSLVAVEVEKPKGLDNKAAFRADADTMTQPTMPSQTGSVEPTIQKEVQQKRHRGLFARRTRVFK